MLKKLFIIAFVVLAIAGCAREEQQAEMESPAETTVGAEATQPCPHHEGACTCKGHEGEPCPHKGEGMMCTCASCGHEWKCDGEGCQITEEGCVCKCPECGAESTFECKGHCAKGFNCTCSSCGHEWKPDGESCQRTDEGCVCTCPECGAETKYECGGRGAKCHGCKGDCGPECTCSCHEGEEHSAIGNPGCEALGCPVATTGQPGCTRGGSCASDCGT
jgi:hypothetical protein